MLWILFLLVKMAQADYSSRNFCADMNPQRHVNIDQLMGMWYGIEILTHHVEEQHYVRIEPTCPILHLSQDRPYPAIDSPYRNYNYQHNYGERQDYQQRQYEREQQYYQQQYGRGIPYSTTYNPLRYGTRGMPDVKEPGRLKIFWDESSSTTNFDLRYNRTQPGFWYSSGPQNGSQLESQFSHFAGTVQVIKAVGSHLVLNFCHQMPDRKLFTIILSRENKLSNADIHGVHNLLHSRGLGTNAITKVCYSGSDRQHQRLMLSSLVLLMLGIVLS